MIMQTRAEDRRTMVQQISEHLQLDAQYQGPPSFSYAIGTITVARDGSITCEDEETLEALKPFLMEKGYIEPEVDTLAISVPIEGLDGNQLRNLMHLLYSNQYLLCKPSIGLLIARTRSSKSVKIQCRNVAIYQGW